MYFLADAANKPPEIFPSRPNPLADWDWFPLVDIDIYNDMILSIDDDLEIAHEMFISAGIGRRSVFAIDGDTKDIQWAMAADYLSNVLNR